MENDDNEIFFSSISDKLLREAIETSKIFNWSKASFIAPKSFYKIKLKRLQRFLIYLFVRTLNFRVLNISKFKKVSFGNENNPIFNFILRKNKNHQHISFLDDGTNTLINNSQNFKFKNDLISFFFFGKKTKIQTPHTRFSIFNSPSLIKDNFVQNNYGWAKQFLSKKAGNPVYFLLGQPLIGLGILSKNNYLEKVEYIVKHITVEGFNCVYIPHRNEIKNNIKDISRIVSIKELDKPIELYLLNAPEIPIGIIGFYSTALFTLSSIFGNNLSVQYLNISKNISNPLFKEKIELVYMDISNISLIKELN